MLSTECIQGAGEFVDHERHLIATLQAEEYTEPEVVALRRFLNSCFEKSPATRPEAVTRWLRFLPGRGEDGLVKVTQAMWNDGHDGPFFARILDKQ